MLLEPHMVNVREKEGSDQVIHHALSKNRYRSQEQKKTKTAFNSAQDYFYRYTGRTVYKNIRL